MKQKSVRRRHHIIITIISSHYQHSASDYTNVLTLGLVKDVLVKQDYLMAQIFHYYKYPCNMSQLSQTLSKNSSLCRVYPPLSMLPTAAGRYRAQPMGG